MHTHFPLPKHTNPNQPTSQPAKKNVLAEKTSEYKADRKHGHSCFYRSKQKDTTLNRYRGHMSGPESVKIRLTYRTSNTRTSSKKGRHWSPLTCNKLILVQSSDPEEGKGGTNSCCEGETERSLGSDPTCFHKGHCGLFVLHTRTISHHPTVK